MVDVNPSESTHFRVIQSSPIEEFNTVSPLPALGQADAATGDESEPLPAETNKLETESPGAAVPPLPASEEIKQAAACSAQPAGKTDSPSRKKGKLLILHFYMYDFVFKFPGDKAPHCHIN